jgi:hypothetical protein
MEKEILLRRLHDEKRGTVILEPQSTYNLGIVGYDEDSNRLIYNYSLLVDALKDSYLEDNPTSCIEEAETCAIDWLEYNTLRSAPYTKGFPVIKGVHDD